MAEQKQEQHTERIVRILAKDIEGAMAVYAGLAKIKGISWAYANAICHELKIPRTKRIGELTPEEIQKISEFAKHPKLPTFILNRQKDRDTGEDKHLTGVDLELTKEFDIKRLKQIKSYRGVRHTLGRPMRGQRTKGNFRKNRARGVGIKKKNKK